MKLLRHGPKGAEKPGLLDANGQVRDLSAHVADIGGEMLVVSQFTLLGDCRRGKRPSFESAASPEEANQLYEQFVELVRARGIRVATGRFRAMMQVHLVNDGPVTLIVDSP